MKLRGKAALVTGAASGIGRAIALALAREGASVGINYTGGDELAQATAKEITDIGSNTDLFEADVRVKSEVGAMFDAFLDRFSKLDILVNNAGVMRNTPFIEVTEAEWDEVIDTNVKGYFLCGQRAARSMVGRKQGKIINISSTRQIQAWPGNSHYCTSKGAIYMLTRSMALELGPLGIRVNAVSPGTIETDLNRGTLNDPEFRQRRVERIPVGYIAQPQAITSAALFLASDEADFVNGASIMVDGGQTIW